MRVLGSILTIFVALGIIIIFMERAIRIFFSNSTYPLVFLNLGMLGSIILYDKNHTDN